MFNPFRIAPLLFFVALSFLSLKINDIIFLGEINAQTVNENEEKDEAVKISPSSGADNNNDLEFKKPSTSPRKSQGSLRKVEVLDDGGVDYRGVLELSNREIRLLYDLRNRSDRLDNYENQLDKRKVLLEVAALKLEEKQQKLVLLKQEIELLVNKFNEDEKKEQEKLIGIYSTMKPKSAATIFNDLDDDTLLGVAQGLNARKLAPIIALMRVDRARMLTEYLASKKFLPKINAIN